MREKVVSFLALFISLGTLLCCALPALLVALGLGAVVGRCFYVPMADSTLAQQRVALPGCRSPDRTELRSGLQVKLAFFLQSRKSGQWMRSDGTLDPDPIWGFSGGLRRGRIDGLSGVTSSGSFGKWMKSV